MFALLGHIKNQRLVNYLVVASYWLFLAPCLTAAIEDRRDAIAQETQRYLAEHFANGQMPPKHDWRQKSWTHPTGVESTNTPGGVGYGYFYDSSALLWTNASIADYYIIAPSSLGGYVSDLYLTSTCRAQLGTESLVAYESSSGPEFWIFDWSQYSAATNPLPWEVAFDLPSSRPQYLTTKPDEFDIKRQMVHVRNGTYCLGFSNGLYTWQNQTLLFDFVRGDWDLIYSTNYATTNLTNNIPGADEFYGSWGPIVETFPPYTNVNPVGFDLIRLFQDGNAAPFWLTPVTSYIYSSANWNLLTQATNTSFTVSYSSNSVTGGLYNLGSLCVTATTRAASFSLSPPGGSNSLYWIVTPNGNLWDKTITGLSPGAYTITFSNVTGFTAPAPQAFTIADNTITTVQANYIGIRPVLQSMTLIGKTLTCVWSAQSNSSYQFQYTTNLAQTNWINLGSPVPATNGIVTTTNSIIANPRAFCRLMLMQ